MAQPAFEVHTAVAVLNGDPPSAGLLTAWAEMHPVYAADGGAAACLAAGVRPEWVVGDGDSVDAGTLPSDWVVLKDTDQEHTDFEKLIARLPDTVKRLVVFGGMGHRFDHVWNNLLLSAALPPAMCVQWVCADARLWRVTPDCAFRQELPADTTLSLLPVGDVCGVNACGLEWPLENATLGAGGQICQSNQVRGAQVEVSVAAGVLFVWFPCHGKPEEAFSVARKTK